MDENIIGYYRILNTISYGITYVYYFVSNIKHKFIQRFVLLRYMLYDILQSILQNKWKVHSTFTKYTYNQFIINVFLR